MNIDPLLLTHHRLPIRQPDKTLRLITRHDPELQKRSSRNEKRGQFPLLLGRAFLQTLQLHVAERIVGVVLLGLVEKDL